MPDDKKIAIEKLGLQEFPAKSPDKVKLPETLPERIEQITRPESGSFERPGRIEKVDISSEGGSRGEIGGIVAQSNVSQRLKQREKEIDQILSQGLEDMYLAMTPEKRQEFKRVGEETSRKINAMLSETKIKVNKIIDLIRNWLALIPGVNRFFLEQETKIKTDEILKLKDKI